MHAVIFPGHISGSLAAPPSKSMTQRAFAAALLHKGITTVYNAGNSADELASLSIIQELGAKVIEQTNDKIVIKSNGINPISDTIYCGESGLAARLFTPIASTSDRQITITGTGSLLSRPMPAFKDVFTQLGVSVSNFSGCLPITVGGPMKSVSISVDAGAGSQFLSGLLFALSFNAISPVIITVERLSSKPYIDMTLEVLKQFGKTITHDNYTTFIIDPNSFIDVGPVTIYVEGDWSSAANLLVAGAIAGEITVSNLNTLSTQADRAIMDILANAGAMINVDKDMVSVSCGQLAGFDFDATHSPDLFPVLSILAACCNGDSKIAGVHRLFHKESNRAESIAEMLENFNVPYSFEEDVLCIEGRRKLQGTIIDSYNDHRIVMAGTLGGLVANGQVDISRADAVNKSYPQFFNHLSLCGVRVVINDQE